jgi:hypothetical protein
LKCFHIPLIHNNWKTGQVSVVEKRRDDIARRECVPDLASRHRQRLVEKQRMLRPVGFQASAIPIRSTFKPNIY